MNSWGRNGTVGWVGSAVTTTTGIRNSVAVAFAYLKISRNVCRLNTSHAHLSEFKRTGY